MKPCPRSRFSFLSLLPGDVRLENVLLSPSAAPPPIHFLLSLGPRAPPQMLSVRSLRSPAWPNPRALPVLLPLVSRQQHLCRIPDVALLVLPLPVWPDTLFFASSRASPAPVQADMCFQLPLDLTLRLPLWSRWTLPSPGVRGAWVPTPLFLCLLPDVSEESGLAQWHRISKWMALSHIRLNVSKMSPHPFTCLTNPFLHGHPLQYMTPPPTTTRARFACSSQLSPCPPHIVH